MIRLLSAELFRLELRTRIPFRYGIATMTDVPQAILRATFEIDGRPETGLAADVLPPKWFTKDPARQLADEISEMLTVIRGAVTRARAVSTPTAFRFWRELSAAQDAWGREHKLPPLLVNFGTSFVERALIHAVCRANMAGFSAALRANIFGLELGLLHRGLAASAPRDWLPPAPSPQVFARHTIGLSDPLEAADIAPGERVDDGLPQTLVESIRFYGLRHFKIKINGEAARDRDRLQRMAGTLAHECGDDYAFSLDGNESFRDVPSFADYARQLMAVPGTSALWPHLLYIEQPWHRDMALSPAIKLLERNWPDRPSIIIDESDAGIDSLPAALELGYNGTSHKNCKGVFKGVANACLLAQRRVRGEPAVLSGEDLANVGPVALIQDLAAQAALGVTSVERNGHHYFAGLAQFPRGWQEHAVARHHDLYVPTTAGWPRLDVRNGMLALGSVNAAPFGVPGELDFSGIPVEVLA
ncbi:MAG: hypothetical protein Q7S40_33685 [Opitutaceae bacterium]|nr:hypothetical protein [Opitutaceae bacterium]